MVEDEAISRYALAQILRSHGYEVIEATDGGEALKLLDEYACDLIITDLVCRAQIASRQSLEFVNADVCHTRQLELEGIIAKRKGSFYEPGRRSGAWLKFKLNGVQEFVIGGYTLGNPFDALIVGCYDDGELRYVSKVRNGFNPRLRRELYQILRLVETEDCPFINLPENKRSRWGLTLTKEEMENCSWLRPKLVPQIEFTEWTPDGHLRHASFVGLRDDKEASDIVREAQVWIGILYRCILPGIELVVANGYRSHFGHVRRVPRTDECEIVGRTRKHRYLLPLTTEMKMFVENMKRPYPKRAASIGADVPSAKLGEGG